MKQQLADGMPTEWKFAIGRRVKIDAKSSPYHEREGEVIDHHPYGYWVKLDDDDRSIYFNYREVVHPQQWIKRKII